MSQGIPLAAVDFFGELRLNNDKAWWDEHKDAWQRDVRDPMQRLCGALADEFGQAKLFRPYRDVRFSADKTPYKEHQGAVIETAPLMGYYVQVSADGLLTGAGWYSPEPAMVARYRVAVDAEASGERLARLVEDLVELGFEPGGDQLKTAPRGFGVDHPRIALLRYKHLLFSRSHGTPQWLDTDEVVARVRDDWHAAAPVMDWLATYVS